MWLNSNPNLRELARRVFGYNGKKFKVYPVEKPIEMASYWDGGSRTYWAAILSNGKIQNFGEMGGLFGVGKVTATPSPDLVILAHCIFCGKDMGVEFYIHPSLMPKFLPAPATEMILTRDHRIVLAATAGLKSSYAGISNYRFIEARRDTGITGERWEVAKRELIEMRLLNKAGAITPDGRNVIGSTRLDDLRRER